MQKGWKPRGESYREAIRYIRGRRRGEITSLKSRWFRFNHASIDGIEWHSTVIIGGRPGSLKTAMKDQLIRDFFEYNPNTNFRVLDFQFEMIGRVTAIRELSSATGKSYKYLCSADGLITPEDYNKCIDYAKVKSDYGKYPVDVYEEGCSLQQFADAIDAYMEEHSTVGVKDNVEIKIYTPTVVTVDHSLLFEDDPNLNR